MAVDFLSYASINEQIALEDHRLLQPHNQMLDYTEISDSNVSELRNSISIHNRIGHARFRRAPPPPSTSGLYQNLVSGFPAPPLTLDPTPFNDRSSMSAEFSTSGNSSSSTFVSSITGEGSVSNGKSGAQRSMFLIPSAPLPSSGKPPVSVKRFREHEHSDNVSEKTPGSGRCHCKKRKSQVKNTIRISTVSSKTTDIPPDEYSWRKYGPKSIKGSPYARGYYKCGTIKGCTARKQVEREKDDPTMMIVTYNGEHGHTQGAMQENTAPGIGACSDKVRKNQRKRTFL